ncbi:putative transferase, protein kinase RLK-Pelle-LRR-I-1 family [Rosa chinensis]|uniref:Putative transferase, protein kinase RLK-Pelle-LRR-I-1 family n=1 Tax=Rosa chinensis TaxID=74649 RepID=A0A2P6PT52_ROSCH|nr:putative transferase, protein kinase RLK-Pelle-LRR-I-1 family [Rosa chinensis]
MVWLCCRYYLTSRLNEKSDVYSFGIVLLEIITNRPVISGTVERIHISQWVASMLAQGDIYNIVDPR